MPKITPAELSYQFRFPAGSGTAYIDLAQCASLVNRRLYRQGKNYYVGSVTAVMAGGGAVTLATVPDTWVTSNAWKKSFSLWREMNQKVLEDNPSVEGKWADFKVFMDELHVNGGSDSAGPTANLIPTDLLGNEIIHGVGNVEWHMSTLVLPQHDVVVAGAAGTPAPADEFSLHMLGNDIAGAGAPDLIKSAAMIHGYSDTRARVQPEPDVPGDMSLSWMTLLTDDGSQEPELADIIEGLNDNPPYNIDNYPGGDINFNKGVTQCLLMSTATLPVDKDHLGFKVPLGLIKVVWQVESYAGVNLRINLIPGTYKGLLATEVQQ